MSDNIMGGMRPLTPREKQKFTFIISAILVLILLLGFFAVRSCSRRAAVRTATPPATAIVAPPVRQTPTAPKPTEPVAAPEQKPETAARTEATKPAPLPAPPPVPRTRSTAPRPVAKPPQQQQPTLRPAAPSVQLPTFPSYRDCVVHYVRELGQFVEGRCDHLQ